jgi:hypothetical protein
MKKYWVTFVLLVLTLLGAVGCAVGPCVGYGCPAFTPAVAQHPTQPAAQAQTHTGTEPKAQAQDNQGVQPAATSGQ